MQEVSEADVYELVRRLVGEYTGGERKFDRHLRLAGDYGIKGFDSIDFLYEVEDHFGINLAPFIERKELKRRMWPFRDKEVVYGLDPTVEEFVRYVMEAIKIAKG